MERSHSQDTKYFVYYNYRDLVIFPMLRTENLVSLNSWLPEVLSLEKKVVVNYLEDDFLGKFWGYKKVVFNLDYANFQIFFLFLISFYW